MDTPLAAAPRLVIFDAPAGEPLAASPTRSPTRAALRSPGRAAAEHDPLLTDLPPAALLEALQATDASRPSASAVPGPLAQSIARAEPEERALGIHAAQTSVQVRAWCDEVLGWTWPREGFTPPTLHSERATNGDAAEPYLGSLPARTVARLEQRVAAIRAARAALDLDTLKTHARRAHLVLDAAPYRPLADLTVVVTATVLQTLPLLDRLARRLELWAVRLFVLRLVPAFRRQRAAARAALASAREATDKAVGEGLTRAAFVVMRRVLRERLAALGATLDRMLDALEGRTDRIPDAWIDDMEDAQAEYEGWAADAESMVEAQELGVQMETARAKASMDSAGAPQSALATADSEQGPSNDAEASSRERAIVDAPQPGDKALPESPPVGARDADDQPFMTPQEEISMDDLLSKGALGLPNIPHTSLDDFMTDIISGQANASPVSPLDFHDANEAPSPAKQRQAEGGLGRSPQVQDATTAVPSGNPNGNSRVALLNGASPPGSAAFKPTPLFIRTDDMPQSESDLSDLSQPNTASSSRFSDMSSPQILDASAVHYYKTPMDEHPPLHFTADDADLARQNSQRTERGAKSHGRSFSAADALSRSRASSYISEMTVGPRTPAFHEAREGTEEEVDEFADSGVALSQASRTSIESLSRSQVNPSHSAVSKSD